MIKKLPKLIIIGHGRHGKDTVCEILRDKYNFKFISSSQYCSEKVIFPILSPNIDSILLNKTGKVRRAKLFYLRERSGKSARIKEKRF